MFSTLLSTYADLSAASYLPFAGGAFGYAVRDVEDGKFCVPKTWEFADGVEAFSVVDAGDGGDSFCVAIRGTEIGKRDDRVRDFIGTRLSYGNGRSAHRGFVDGADELCGHILNQATKLGRNRVVLTGHSLGGGIAACCVNGLAANGLRVRLVTFGCPMVGNLRYAESMSAKLVESVRVVNCADYVTRMWSQKVHGWLCGDPWHHHPGRQYYFDGDGDLHLDPSRSFVASQVAWGWMTDWRGSFRHHSIREYQSISKGHQVFLKQEG